MIRTAGSVLALLAASLSGAVVSANDNDGREAQMKAAYIFNFVKFVEWPGARDSSAIRICFIGADQVSAALSAATANKDVGGRPIEVKSMGGATDAAQCDVLYSESSIAKTPDRMPSVLTIGASSHFTKEGGIIRLYTESNRLRFIVNVENAKRVGLQVSSHLLKLASHVEHEAAP